MTIKKKAYRANFLKEETTPAFAKWFKRVVYSKTIPWGCKVYLLSCATLPSGAKHASDKHGRKLGTTGHQLRKWSKLGEYIKPYQSSTD